MPTSTATTTWRTSLARWTARPSACCAASTAASARSTPTRRRFADRRAYDLFVLSDHGMSPCTPFQERYGQTLGQFMASLAAKGHAPVELDETFSREWRTSTEARYLLEELEGISANLSSRSQRLAGVLRNFLARRIPTDDEHEYDLSRQRDLIVRNSGTMSLVYFPLTTQQMDLSEIELVYPGLLRSLVEQPGLGLVLGREHGEAMAMTVRGPRRLLQPGRSADPRPAGQPADPALAAQQLARLVSFANSGDLVLFGRWDAAARPSPSSRTGPPTAASAATRTAPSCCCRRAWTGT